MPLRRAQATTELIAVIGVIVLLVLVAASAGAFSWLPGAVREAVRSFDGGVAEPPPAAAITFLEQAIARPAGTDGPLVQDAIARLAVAIGPERARAIAIDRILRRYGTAPRGRQRALGDPSWALAVPAFNGAGAGTDAVWSEESPRAPTVARLRTAADERRWQAAQAPSTADRVVSLGTAAAVGIAASVNPATAVAVAVIDAEAAAAEHVQVGVPSGSREGDVVLCRFVWRRNGATPTWISTHPVEALRLALDERLPAVVLTVVRGGRVLSHDVVRSHAATC